MRDDIHKHAPLPSRWQAVMRRFQSSAERPAALLAMQQAVARDAKEQISGEFLRDLLGGASAFQSSFDGFTQPQMLFTSGGGNRTEMELAVNEVLGRTSTEHQSRFQAVHAAVAEVLEGRLHSNCDAMETTWYVHAPGDIHAKQSADAMWQTYASCGIRQTVDDLIAGRTPACLSNKPRQIDLDDNLLLPSARQK